MQKYIFDQETALKILPKIPFGVTMVRPVLIEYGTEEQKKKFLPQNFKFGSLVVPRLFGTRSWIRSCLFKNRAVPQEITT